MPKKRWCPTHTKPKYFNDAWAKIAARESEVKYGSNLRTYKCRCGWWHVYDRDKARQKDEALERRSARRQRRRREKRDGTDERAVWREARRREQEQKRQEALERTREHHRQKQRRRRRQAAVAWQTWENEGGALFHVKHPPGRTPWPPSRSS